MIGETFGQLTVYFHIDGYKVICRCTCGKFTLAGPNDLRAGNKKSCGCLHKKTAAENGRKKYGAAPVVPCEICGVDVILQGAHRREQAHHFCSAKCMGIWKSENLTGDKIWNWKGGHTQSERHTKAYSDWRLAVFAADDYTCQRCGDGVGGNLNAHHLKAFADHPDQRVNVDNGATLCEGCHVDFHRLYGTRGFTEEDYYEFIEGGI